MKKDVVKFESLTKFIDYMKTNSGIWISADEPERRVIGFEKDNVRIEIGIMLIKDEISQELVSSETEMFKTWEGRKEFGENFCK